MKTCIYCNSTKNESEFNNLEHIFPESLGGKACNELFKTRDVCKSCNNFCGLWVDGAFLKDSFVKNYKALDDLKYVDFENGSIHNLTYLGRIDTELAGDDEICEVWIGPCGDKIYHFHSNYREKFFSYTGGDPISSKKRPGRVYFFTATNNKNWLKIAIFSFYHHFKKVKRFSGNVKLVNEKDHTKIFDEPGNYENEIINGLRKIINTPIDIKFSTKLDIEQLFFSKIALGLGYNLLGLEFLNTNHAEKLRENITDANKSNQDNIYRVCSPFFNEDKDLNEKLAWKGGHTFILLPQGRYLLLLINLFGRQMFQVVISDSIELWRNNHNLIQGQVYVLIPQRSLFKGPFTYHDYLFYLNGLGDIPELSELKSMIVDRTTLPPYWSENL